MEDMKTARLAAANYIVVLINVESQNFSCFPRGGSAGGSSMIEMRCNEALALM